MPVTAATNDVFQVKVRGRIEGQETNNIFYFAANTAIDDVEVRLILVLASCFITHLLPQLGNAWTLQDLVWKQVFPVLGPENITIPAGDLQGDIATDTLPSFCSAVVSVRTAQGGRSRRGRFYLAGTPEAATDGSAFDTGHAFWTALANFLACLATNFFIGDPPAANSLRMMVYSRKIAGTSSFPPPNATCFAEVTSLKAVQALGTTRSRKVGRGA